MSHPHDRFRTRLESPEEIQEATAARNARLGLGPVTPGKPQPATDPEIALDRPRMRPPMALLIVSDDGRPATEGETFRLRRDVTAVGRTDGDVLVPHDPRICPRHAEIVRQRRDQGGWQWLLRDLDSKHGTYVRISGTLLKSGNELLVGAGRYRFEEEAEGQASLSEIGANDRPGRRHPLTAGESWVGRDARCAIARAGDELASPKHAVLSRDAKGVWSVRHGSSLNGLWLRLSEPLPLPGRGACQIRMGEQKFYFRGME